MSNLDIRGSVARGGGQAEQMLKENPSGGGRGPRTNWFGLKDGDVTYLRFLDDADEWPSVFQHPFVPTRPVPNDYPEEAKKNWPKMMSPVCRNTQQFQHFFPEGCYICNGMEKVRPGKSKTTKYYPQVRVWARAIERELVLADEEVAKEFNVPVGEEIGYRNVEIEIEKLDSEGNSTGEKIWVPKIVVINMAMKNFFQPLYGFAEAYRGTVLDRDYRIKRRGEGINTDYDIVAMPPVPDETGARFDMRTATDSQGRLLRKIYDEIGPDLFDIIESRIDDRFYDTYFDDRHPVPERKQREDSGEGGSKTSSPESSTTKSTPSTPESSASTVDPVVSKDKLNAMRAKMLSSRAQSDHPAGQQSQDGAQRPEGASESQKVDA